MRNPIRNMKVVACFTASLALLMPAIPVQAQQNQSLELAFDSRDSYSGTPNQTGPDVTVGPTYLVGVVIDVPYQGSATVACYEITGGQVYAQVFYNTYTTSQAPVTFQYKPALGQHGLYCSGSFSGYGFGGTLTTGTISFQAVNP